MGFSFMAMANFQQALDLYLPTQVGKDVRADSPDIKAICCDSKEIAGTELRIWAERHADKCTVLPVKPMTIRIIQGMETNDILNSEGG